MDIVKLDSSDFAAVAFVWEASVRATHGFLEEEYLQAIKGKLPDGYLPFLELYGIKSGDGKLAAFLGVSADKIEVLFVHPDFFRMGLGGKLLKFAVEELSIKNVDVNEENPGARAFYESFGFQFVSRDEFDSEGWPHPILHLKRPDGEWLESHSV